MCVFLGLYEYVPHVGCATHNEERHLFLVFFKTKCKSKCNVSDRMQKGRVQIRVRLQAGNYHGYCVGNGIGWVCGVWWGVGNDHQTTLPHSFLCIFIFYIFFFKLVLKDCQKPLYNSWCNFGLINTKIKQKDKNKIHMYKTRFGLIYRWIHGINPQYQ